MSDSLWSTKREEREICMLPLCVQTGIPGERSGTGAGLGFLPCLNTTEKLKTAQLLGKNGEEGGFCLAEKLCFPVH